MGNAVQTCTLSSAQAWVDMTSGAMAACARLMAPAATTPRPPSSTMEATASWYRPPQPTMSELATDMVQAMTTACASSAMPWMRLWSSASMPYGGIAAHTSLMPGFQAPTWAALDWTRSMLEASRNPWSRAMMTYWTEAMVRDAIERGLDAMTPPGTPYSAYRSDGGHALAQITFSTARTVVDGHAAMLAMLAPRRGTTWH
jgi:hypothetical protein